MGSLPYDAGVDRLFVHPRWSSSIPFLRFSPSPSAIIRVISSAPCAISNAFISKTCLSLERTPFLLPPPVLCATSSMGSRRSGLRSNLFFPRARIVFSLPRIPPSFYLLCRVENPPPSNGGPCALFAACPPLSIDHLLIFTPAATTILPFCTMTPRFSDHPVVPLYSSVCFISARLRDLECVVIILVACKPLLGGAFLVPLHGTNGTAHHFLRFNLVRPW